MAVRSTIRETFPASAEHARTIVLLDEHPIWLDALEVVLATAGLRVVGKATAPEEALELLAETKPHGFAASIELPSSSMDGVECLRRARERAPELRIVAFATHDEAFRLTTALAAGADAYLPKTAAGADIASTVRDCLLETNGGGNGLRARELKAIAAQPALTAREAEILQLVAQGHTNVQIAEQLWVTKWTVKFHLVNAYRKLGVQNRTQAARYVFDHGLTQLPLDRSA